MVPPEAYHLNFALISPDSADDELDHLTRQLLMELKDLELESVKLVSADDIPDGTKGIDPVLAGTLAVAVLPTMLPKLLEFLQSWTLRGRGRTIKFNGEIAGQQISFEGSMAEMERLVTLLEQKQKNQKTQKKLKK